MIKYKITQVIFKETRLKGLNRQEKLQKILFNLKAVFKIKKRRQKKVTSKGEAVTTGDVGPTKKILFHIDLHIYYVFRF